MEMSANNIPFDLQVEIIKRVLPVKSLIRFRSVSKQWKSLIDSSRFIIDHSLKQTQPHLMLASYKPDYEDLYASIVDDDKLLLNKFSPIRPPPNVTSSTCNALMLDCSHGLVCLYCVNDAVVLWNPSIRKSVEIVLPHESDRIVVGVGVCPTTSDPKVVKVSADWKAEVFTLSTGEWRSISMNLSRPLKPFRSQYNHVVVDGVIHWVASYLISTIGVIISFDLTSEEFGEVVIPDSLSPRWCRNICKLKDSLALVDGNNQDDHYDVWMMIKNGDPKCAFTKLFSIDFETSDDSIIYVGIIGFRNNGQPIIKEYVRDTNRYMIPKLRVYEPSSKRIKDLEIDTTYKSVFLNVTSYTESLLLLDQDTYNIH